MFFIHNMSRSTIMGGLARCLVMRSEPACWIHAIKAWAYESRGETWRGKKRCSLKTIRKYLATSDAIWL